MGVLVSWGRPIQAPQTEAQVSQGPAPRRLRLGAGGPLAHSSSRSLPVSLLSCALWMPLSCHVAVLSLCLRVVFPLHIAVCPLSPLTRKQSYWRGTHPPLGLTLTAQTVYK